jgi:leucyl aminopeptidase
MASVKLISSLENSKAKTLVIPVVSSNWDSIWSQLQAVYILSETVKEAFKGSKGENITLFPNTVSTIKKLVLIGLGEKPSVTAYNHAIRLGFHQIKPKTDDAILVQLSGAFDEEKEFGLLVKAAFLGWEPIIQYKKETESSPKLNLEILLEKVQKSHKKVVESSLDRAIVKKMVMDLVNRPANELYPSTWAKMAKKEGEKRSISVEILKENELEKKGFGGILAVGRGAENQPRLIIMDYKPEKYNKTVALIGKGVIFDTGGVSIKQSANMHLMKCDMAGGANVMGAVCSAADLNLPVRVIAVIPAVQNTLDGNAYVPGDIIKTYAGLTIEVIDTDAEGRIILADALAYTSNEIKPDIMLDLATLTGASVTALGYHAAAVFSQNDNLVQGLIEAGDESGDRLWRLPLWDEYGQGLSSDMADVKNYDGPPAGAIFAGKFLEKFTENHTAWAHLDIAGMVMQAGPFSKDRSATGYGFDLLVDYLIQLSEKE